MIKYKHTLIYVSKHKQFASKQEGALAMMLCLLSHFGLTTAAAAIGVLLLPFSVCANKLPELPSGASGAGRFGAYYTTLKYEERWDAPWRISDHADVVVQFATGGHKFVFWRGTSYIPCWVTDTGIWYTNEFVERNGADSPNTRGCCEPMSDKQCRYSHVRIIESTDARVVVHWRYAPVDTQYNHPFIDPDTGWSDWVDEYYYIYPDAVGVRKITVHSTQLDKWMEWHEAIVLNQPGTMPEDNIELDAISIATMQGESKTYTWDKNGAPRFENDLADANILKVNLKATLKPFAITPPATKPRGPIITSYRGHGKGSCFNFWDHWPVSHAASDGRLAESSERPSHSSLAHIGKRGATHWNYYAQGDQWRTRIMLHGMTDLATAELTPLAKSWAHAPELKIMGEGYIAKGYDQAERAYQMESITDHSAPLSFSIDAKAERPLINPAFVIKNWNDDSGEVALRLNKKKCKPADAFRSGYHHTLEGTNLIVWLNVNATETTEISILRM